MKKYKQLLKKLTKAYSPSGCETVAKKLFKSIAAPFVDECYEDIHGNLICYKRGNSDKSLMLIAHIDEVGLMVKYIEESGYIRFSAVGGVDISLLPGKSVVILHNEELVQGIIGSVPIHCKKNVNSLEIDVSDLWIDIGATSKEEAIKSVSIGDAISIESGFYQLSNDIISSRAIDDKSGIAVLATVLANLSSESLNYSIYVVASIQEEVGIRGAITSSYAINPDVCIAIDVTHATDYPSANRAKQGDIKINGGVVIPLGTDFSPKLQNALIGIALSKEITYQVEARPGFSGTDIHSVQVTRGGCVTGLVSIPCRYMHSPQEAVSSKDIDCTVRLITEFCKYHFDEIVKV